MRVLIAGLVAAGFFVLPAAAAAPPGLIVFSRVVDGDDRELFVVRPDGSGLTRLTDDDIGESAPALSPDRALVASAAEDELIVHSTSGRLVRRISAPGEGTVSEPRWSPTGQRISFLVERCGEDDVGPVRACADLWVVRPDGSDLRRLVAANVSTNDLVPAYAWAPGGSSIVFERYRPRGLVVVGAAGGPPRALRGTTSLASSDPSWSRRGWIVFARERGRFQGYDVYRVRSNGTRLRRVARARTAARPIWSRDGRRIAFLDAVAGTPSRWRVIVVRADGSGRRVLGQGASDLTLAWSPDGSWLLWETTDHRLLIGRADGRGRPKMLARGTVADWR